MHFLLLMMLLLYDGNILSTSSLGMLLLLCLMSVGVLTA
jgi:hypothetical protein